MELFSGLWTLIVATVAFISGSCFTIFAPDGFLDRETAICFSGIGVIGTTFLVPLVCWFSRRPSSWHFLELRRNVVLLVFGIAWVFGAFGGLAIFYVIPRAVVS
jgi:hypothetical protein